MTFTIPWGGLVAPHSPTRIRTILQISLSTDGHTASLSDAISEREEAEHQLLQHAQLRIWNFDEYTPEDIDQIIEDGEVRFGGHRLFIDDA